MENTSTLSPRSSERRGQLPSIPSGVLFHQEAHPSVPSSSQTRLPSRHKHEPNFTSVGSNTATSSLIHSADTDGLRIYPPDASHHSYEQPASTRPSRDSNASVPTLTFTPKSRSSKIKLSRTVSIAHIVHQDLCPGTFRYNVSSVIASSWFEWAVGCFIILNFGLVVHETNVRAEEGSVPFLLEAILFCIPFVFLIEVMLRVYVLRLHFFQRWPNVVDIIIIVTDMGAVIFGAIVGNIPSISVLRIFRIMRVLRAVKALSKFRELQLMLAGIAAAMRAMFWSTFLLFFTLMVFSIVAVEVLDPVVRELGADGDFGDCAKCAMAFESVWQSMLTFFQQIIAGDSWGAVTVPTMRRHPWTAIIFIPIFVIVNFGLLNLVMAVIVENSLGAREEQKTRETIEQYDQAQTQLVELFKELDEDHSGGVCISEVMKGIEDNAQFAAFLRGMHISNSDIEMMFQMLDEDGSGQVDLSEFVEGLHKMKTESSHTLLMLIRHYTLEVRQKVREQIQFLQAPVLETLARVDKEMNCLKGNSSCLC